MARNRADDSENILIINNRIAINLLQPLQHATTLNINTKVPTVIIWISADDREKLERALTGHNPYNASLTYKNSLLGIEQKFKVKPAFQGALHRNKQFKAELIIVD